jgi:subtilase family serine protease
VGGTHLTLNAGNLRLSEFVETVTNDPGYRSSWGSGGGISNIFPVPAWQTGLTYQPYFRGNNYTGPTTTLTNRGIPDISAPMNTYGLWLGNTIAGYGGTSASAPVMAGIMARFISLNGGRRPIPGSIHSTLYSNVNAYYDIASGNNDTILSEGYVATPGWDPVTGLGAPWGNVIYPMITSGGTKVKTGANTWSYVANVRVKTAPTTWANVQAIWTKTINGWSQTF